MNQTSITSKRARCSFVLLTLLSLIALARTASAQSWPTIIGTYHMIETNTMVMNVGGSQYSTSGGNDTYADVLQTNDTFNIVTTNSTRVGVLVGNSVTNVSGPALYMNPAWTATTNQITSSYGTVTSNRVDIYLIGSASGYQPGGAFFQAQVSSHIVLYGTFHPLIPPTITTQPVGLTYVLGTSATFSVEATGAAPLIYQWRKGGLLIPYATNATYTIDAISATDAGTYMVQISNAAGATNSANAKLAINYPPSITTQPAKLLKQQLGTKATLSVKATGTGKLSYQWLKFGNSIPGATNTTLSVIAVPDQDTGATNLIYNVSISNAYGTIVSSNAVVQVLADTVLPKVTVTQPAANARISTTKFIGTATDNGQVSGVTYWITNLMTGAVSAPQNAVLNTNASSVKWEINAEVSAGTNVLVVQSTDLQGNHSKTIAQKFFYQMPTPFTLTTGGTGNGSVAGKSSVAGAREPKPIVGTTNLYIGQTYTLQATPNATSFFTNWTGSLGVLTNPTLNFVMLEGFEFQANFVTNLFIGMAGTYNGLFSDTNAIAPQSSGMLRQLVVDKKGGYTGQLIVNGTTYSISGKFDMSGHAVKTISRAANVGGPVTVDITLDWNNTPHHVFGTVSASNWTAQLDANQAGKSLPGARFTILLPPSTDGTPSPAGSGYILATNNGVNVTMSGTLADGTPFTQTVPVSNEGQFPIYAGLYKGAGMLSGWIDLSSGTPSGTLTWIKLPTTGLYPQGFTNVTAVESSVWTIPAAKTPALPFTTNAPGLLELTGGDLAAPLSFNIAVTANNAIVKTIGSATNALTGTVDPKTGLFKVTVGSGKTAINAFGAVLQNTTTGGGLFVGKSSAGAVTLQKN